MINYHSNILAAFKNLEKKYDLLIVDLKEHPLKNLEFYSAVIACNCNKYVIFSIDRCIEFIIKCKNYVNLIYLPGLNTICYTNVFDKSSHSAILAKSLFEFYLNLKLVSPIYYSFLDCLKNTKDNLVRFQAINELCDISIVLNNKSFQTDIDDILNQPHFFSIEEKLKSLQSSNSEASMHDIEESLYRISEKLDSLGDIG